MTRHERLINQLILSAFISKPISFNFIYISYKINVSTLAGRTKKIFYSRTGQR